MMESASVQPTRHMKAIASCTRVARLQEGVHGLLAKLMPSTTVGKMVQSLLGHLKIMDK